MTMITKEQAKLVLKAVNPPLTQEDQLTGQLAETVIALHERVERLEVVSALLDVEVNGGGLGDAGRIEARAVLKKVYAHD